MKVRLVWKVLPAGEEYTTEEVDLDLGRNISGDEFDCEFPSGQKVFSSQHCYSHSVLPLPVDTSRFTSSPTHRTPLAPRSSNIAPPSTQRTLLVPRSSHINLPKPVPETETKRKRGLGKKKTDN